MPAYERHACWRVRMTVAALGLFFMGGLFPCAAARLPVADIAAKVHEAALAENGCVANPLGWDPHLDWSAGPPC